MGKRTIILSLLCCFLSVNVLAADKDYIIEIKPMKKVIHVDKLGFGETTPILHVLETMPELLGRTGVDENVLKNYSILVDWRDVGQSRDVVLQQTIVAEVNVIEITTSPTSSEQNNGTGGKINILLKPVEKEGVSGMAILDAAAAWDVQPSVLINYKTDKFSLRSSVRAQYYRPTSYYYNSIERPDTTIEHRDTAHLSYKQETAKLYMQYKPTQQDELNVNLMESYARSQQWSNMPENKNEERLTAEAFVGYRRVHVSHKGDLKLEARYSYLPSNTIEQVNISTTENNAQSHQVTGDLRCVDVVYDQGKHWVELRYGLNTKYDFGKGYRVEEERLGDLVIARDTLRLGNGHIYASPYAEVNYTYGAWDMHLGGRYQYYRVNLDDARTQLSYTDNHTYTGDLSIRCHVAPDHHLRLMMARNIRRKIGIDNITILPYYNADLNYIYEWQDDLNHITTSVSANYIYARQEVGYTGTACANAMLVFQRGIFSMSFAANAYMRTPYENKLAGKRCWYYNLNLLPVLNLPKEWYLSCQLMYNSKVEYLDDIYGDCFYTQLRLAKQIRGWNIHLEADNIFGYTTRNRLQMPNGIAYTNWETLYPRMIKLGFFYMF